MIPSKTSALSEAASDQTFTSDWEMVCAAVGQIRRFATLRRRQGKAFNKGKTLLLWQGRSGGLTCSIRTAWSLASRPIFVHFKRMGKKPVSVEVRLSKPRSEAQVYTKRKVPTLTTEQRNELGEGYRKAHLTNSTLDKAVKRGLLGSADAERLKDPAIAMSEVLYVCTDEDELLFSVLLYLLRNVFVELTPKMKAEWAFIKKFTRAADDSQTWEVMKRLENPFTYAERPGGMRGYVRAIKRTLSSRERTTEILAANIETFGAEYEAARRAAAQKPVPRSPSGEYALADAAHILRIPQRTLYRWYEHGAVDAIKIKGVLALTPKGMEQAERLIIDRRLREQLMDKMVARGWTESAAKKMIQRGLENGETFIEIAKRVQARSAGRGHPSVD